MNIWIIEDELPAARRLHTLLQKLLPQAVIRSHIDSVAVASEAFNQQQPDLAFFDINLADGNSFSIFEKATVHCPIIFTTAYDDFALDAFKYHTLDYLLKPVKPDELERAIQKFQKLNPSPPDLTLMKQLVEEIQMTKKFKQRFLAKSGEHLKTIETDQIAYFYTENKVTFLVLPDGKKYLIDYNLDQLQQHLDPQHFFRINRQFIISIKSIADMYSYTKARVVLVLQPSSKLETIVSSERAAAFKQWLDDATT